MPGAMPAKVQSSVIWPLGKQNIPPPRELSPAFWGLNAHAGKQRFSTAMLNGPQVMSLDELVTFLDETYGGRRLRQVNVASLSIPNDEWVGVRGGCSPTNLVGLPQRCCEGLGSYVS